MSYTTRKEAELLARAVPQVYEVSLSPAIDEARGVTVTAIGEGLAHILKIAISCKQPDGTWKGFIVYPNGEVPSAVPGPGNLQFPVMSIVISNEGTVRDTLYIRVVDDTGVQIGYWEGDVDVGGQFANTSVTFDMPPRNYSLTIEVGHL
jgi:hypothetical protein